MENRPIFKTIPEQLEAHLRRDILSGALEAGHPLREHEISERFGVSRGPVREVLYRLAQQGLVTSEANKGVRVAGQPSDALRPLLVDLRQRLEAFVLDDIFDRITDEHLEAWGANLARIERACRDGDSSALVEHDLAFHSAIIRAHENPDLFTLWQPIVLRMLIHYERLGDLMESYHEHKRILDAIRDGDRDEALAALAANIQ